MKVVVEYPAPMCIRGTPSGAALEIPAGTTVAGLLELLGLEARHRAHVAAFVNASRAPAQHVLADGDQVLLHVPVGGG